MEVPLEDSLQDGELSESSLYKGSLWGKILILGQTVATKSHTVAIYSFTKSFKWTGIRGREWFSRLGRLGKRQRPWHLDRKWHAFAAVAPVAVAYVACAYAWSDGLRP